MLFVDFIKDFAFRMTHQEFIKEFNKINQKTTILQTPRQAYRLYKTAQNIRINGCFAEVGVYTGGSAVLINKACNQKKTIYLFDTFKGTSKDEGKFYKGQYTCPLKRVKKAVNSNNIVFIKGDITQKKLPDVKFALVHYDADLSEVLASCLERFNTLIVANGIIIIHDYEGQNKAVTEKFIKEHQNYSLKDHGDGQAILHKNEV